MKGKALLLCGALFACAWLATGCSAIPKASAMRAHDVESASQWPWSAAVRVSGGQDFDFRISDAEFERALRESLVETGMFSRVVELGASDYRLDVVLGDGRGLEGRELTVLWNLSRADTQETVWQEFVTSNGRSYHFVGVIRGRRGLELAAQENIRLGLERLSRVDLEALARPAD
jgi:hypothetical protein